MVSISPMTDLTQLEALARAATPGEWFQHPNKPNTLLRCNPAAREAPQEIAVCASSVVEYIAAANPAAILALIERVRVAEGALADVRDACDGQEDADDGIPNLAIRCMTIAEGKNRP